MMNITEFPAEILHKIFINFLPSFKDDDYYYQKRVKIKQLIGLTEVCKLFNEIIGKSERLMRWIMIRWDGNTKDPAPLLTTSRIYRNIKLSGGSGAFFGLAHFLKTQPKLSYMYMNYDLHLQTYEFSIIIDFVRNSLQELHLSRIELDGDPISKPIHMPNLRKLHIKNFANEKNDIEKIFRIFGNSESLEVFEFNSDGSHSSDFWMTVESFLINCKRLKELYLKGTIMDKIFKASNFAERVHFQLDKLDLSWKYSDTQTVPNFLYNQASLKDLSLNFPLVTDKLLNAILGIKTLKNLELLEPQLQIVGNIYVRSASIESIEILNYYNDVRDDDFEWYTAVCKIIKGCPAVRSLLLYKVSFSEMVAQCVMENQKRLELLQVDMDKIIHPINIKTLRTLLLEGIDNGFLNDDQALKVFDLIKINPQLTKIKVSYYFEGHEKLEELSSLAEDRLEYCDF